MPPTVIVHAPLPTLDTLPGAEADYQYFAQYHRHRLLNGNSGFYPPNYTLTLSRTEAFPDRRSLAELRRAGAEYLLVHAQYFPKPEAFAAAMLSLETQHRLDGGDDLARPRRHGPGVSIRASGGAAALTGLAAGR